MKHIPIRHINTPQEEQKFSGSFSIRDIHELLAGKDIVQELHRHDFFYILALKKGRGNHEIDFRSYEIRDYSIFLMRPGQVHQLTLKAGSSGYLIEFNTDFHFLKDKVSSDLLRKATDLNHYQFEANSLKRLVAILDYIFEEYTIKKERYQDVIKANLEIFFIELIRQNSNATPNNTDTYTQECFEKFSELLKTHIAKHKQVSFYADKLSLSLYQLNAIAKATRGKTCSEIMNEYIILESKRYLLATSNQVNQIASYLGYEDVSYFIRFFKKHTGQSPEAFRNNFK